MPETAQSRLERWAPGRLDQIEQALDAAHQKRANRETGTADLLSTAIRIEELEFEASLLRTLLQNRNEGIAAIHGALTTVRLGDRDVVERSRRQADAALALLAEHGDLLTDAEFRQAVAGRNALSFRG